MNELANSALLVVCVGGALLFAGQSLCWFLLRSKRMGVPRWRRLSGLFLALSAVLSLAGLASITFADEALRAASTMALGAGGINGFITLFHRRVLSWLEQHQRGH